MTLKELAVEYRESARKIDERIKQLNSQKRASKDIHQIRSLECRIRVLESMRRDAMDLAALTEHYHDRGYHSNERYKI